MFKSFGFLSALLLSASLHLALIGCSCPSESSQASAPQVQMVSSNPGCVLTITALGTNDWGYWRLVELQYNDQKHVYLQHYDRNNQSMTEVIAK